jgi:acetoin utilization protein AcuB
MRIENWMTRKVQEVRPLDSILHARELMVDHRINQLPVVVKGKLVGIVTDRDVRDALPSALSPEWPTPRKKKRKESSGLDPKDVTVEMVMTPNVFTLGTKDGVVDAVRVMLNERIGAVPIVDDGQLVGILTRSDVLNAFVQLSEAGATK